MALSSITNAATSLLGKLASSNEPSIKKADNPRGVIIGPQAGKSQVQQFHDFLLSEIGNIPLATQWVVQIDKLPDVLKTNLNAVETNLEPGDWFTARRAASIDKAIKDGVFIDKGVCIFAQGIQTNGEALNIEKVTPSVGFHGGLLGGPISTGRNPLADVNIAFLETNYSFLDFIVRPWIIYTSHYGLMARKVDDPKNIKTTIQIFFYDRGGNTRPRIRKIFRFYNAAPVRVEGIISTWDDQEVKKVYTSWTYSHYDVSSESIDDALFDIRKTASNNQFISNLSNNFGKSTIQVPNTSLVPSAGIGSEALSNPVAFNTPTTFTPQGGAVIGGNYGSSFSSPNP